MDITPVDRRASVILDLKTPGSGEMDNNLLANLPHLQSQDEVKFVITDRADYEWAKTMMTTQRLNDTAAVLFSPWAERLAPPTLADWILQDRLEVRFQIQLHKTLWGDARGR
jgi:7-carboxy-7-deazaguanine synthase